MRSEAPAQDLLGCATVSTDRGAGPVSAAPCAGMRSTGRFRVDSSRDRTAQSHRSSPWGLLFSQDSLPAMQPPRRQSPCRSLFHCSVHRQTNAERCPTTPPDGEGSEGGGGGEGLSPGGGGGVRQRNGVALGVQPVPCTTRSCPGLSHPGIEPAMSRTQLGRIRPLLSTRDLAGAHGRSASRRQSKQALPFEKRRASQEGVRFGGGGCGVGLARVGRGDLPEGTAKPRVLAVGGAVAGQERAGTKRLWGLGGWEEAVGT